MGPDGRGSKGIPRQRFLSENNRGLGRGIKDAAKEADYHLGMKRTQRKLEPRIHMDEDGAPFNNGQKKKCDLRE